MIKRVRISDRVSIGGGAPLALIAGPCVIEGRRACLDLARRLTDWAGEQRIPFIFKASYDKANRSSGASFRGPGLEAGLAVLAEVRERFRVPVLTDVHREEDAAAVARVVDVLQVPAFLCRQTDLILAMAATGRPVNVKKGQFLAPWDMGQVVAKIEEAGNRRILLTERGTSFGYRNLVADMRSMPIMRQTGYPVIFDATHSVQLPGAGGTKSGGEREWAPYLARAAVAAGCDAVFVETHPRPERGLSDAANMMRLPVLRRLWPILKQIDELVRH